MYVYYIKDNYGMKKLIFFLWDVKVLYVFFKWKINYGYFF